MPPRHALKIILSIALFGAAFSGTLAYQELFIKTALSCPALGAPGTVFGYPACVYGFFMYLALASVAGFGLRPGTVSEDSKEVNITPRQPLFCPPCY